MDTPVTTTQPTPVSMQAPTTARQEPAPAPPPADESQHDEPGYGHGV